MKSNKSYSKRLRVTRKGKVIARKSGQNHFNAKDSGTAGQKKARDNAFHATLDATAKSRFLS